MTDDDFRDYLAGVRLYGDDFDGTELVKWYVDELEAYAALSDDSHREQIYPYHALNVALGFRHLPPRWFSRVLGFGSAGCAEFIPIISRIGQLIIIEPSVQFKIPDIAGRPVNWVMPSPDGRLPFRAESFDLITCFGTLHHIAPVSRVLREFHRVLRQGGYLLLREPTISMGDWRRPRPGLTKRERGIPSRILLHCLVQSGFSIIRAERCMLSVLSWMGRRVGFCPFNSRLFVAIDMQLCRAPLWRDTYHPTTLWGRAGPSALFVTATKSPTKL